MTGAEDGVGVDRDWLAVRGDTIASRADSKEHARRAADHLGNPYDEIVATPAGGIPHVF